MRLPQLSAAHIDVQECRRHAAEDIQRSLRENLIAQSTRRSIAGRAPAGLHLFPVSDARNSGVLFSSSSIRAQRENRDSSLRHFRATVYRVLLPTLPDPSLPSCQLYLPPRCPESWTYSRPLPIAARSPPVGPTTIYSNPLSCSHFLTLA